MAADQKSNFLSWFVGLFMGGNDPEREKRRLLKQLGKDLGKLRFKFYRVKEEMATPQLAKFIYEVYKVTAHASQLLVGADTSQALKDITIDFHLDEEQRKLRDSLTEPAIRELAKTMDPKFLASRLKDDLVNFMSTFDSNSVRRINGTYNLILRFINFVRYDFYFCLKKFDSTLAEGDVTGSPKFEAINGEYVVDDLKDFLEAAMPVEKEVDWDPVFEILKTYKGVEVANRQAWSRIVQILRNIIGADILAMIVRYDAEDPYWKPQVAVPGERIVENYLNKLKAQTEAVIQKIVAEKRSAKVDKLVEAVFGGPVNPRTKYYTDRANQSFSKRIGAAYTFTLPMNYLKAFLLDFFKKDVRELADLLLVRGKWTTNVLSQQMSDYYYQVLNMTESLLEFDESLGDEGEVGSKLKRAQSRVVDRDESTARPVRTMIEDINAKAQKIIAEAANSLISFGKGLKSLIEDLERIDHELVINWKELSGVSELPLKGRMGDVYKKIYYFIQLMQMYAKGGTGADEPDRAATEEKAAAVSAAAEIDDDELS